MANRKQVVELRDRDRVQEIYLCARKNILADRNGRRYLSLLLADRSGEIGAMLWDDAERRAERFAAGDLVEVSGSVVVYQGRLQLHLSDIRRAEHEALSAADFLRGPPRDEAVMWQELRELLGTVEDPDLARLVAAYCADEELVDRILRGPAAKTIHHAYLGGLLEHTLSVVRLADRVCAHYDLAAPGLLCRDVCLVGAFLHDLGKVEELSLDGGLHYSDRGRLLGHLAIGLELLDAKLREVPDFPEPLADDLRHIVLSHHGRLEYGSPKRPKTAEAALVHRLDELDSFLASLREILDQPSPEPGWTAYHQHYQQYFRRPQVSSGPPMAGKPAVAAGASVASTAMAEESPPVKPPHGQAEARSGSPGSVED